MYHIKIYIILLSKCLTNKKQDFAGEAKNIMFCAGRVLSWISRKNITFTLNDNYKFRL